jgi:anaerobic selenocysteine-containing dehydrogenase
MNNINRANLFENWIQEIRNNHCYYCYKGWKFHLSGSVIEFSVIPDSTKDRNIYRCSAITIGQILKTLSYRIENEGLHFHIQSFPSIQNPEIVAAIRVDENSYHLPEVFPKIETGNNVKTLQEWLIHISAKYRFNLVTIQKPEYYHTGFTSNHPGYWFALTSLSDNPFVWLNLGYWKETLLIHTKKIFPETDLTVFDFCKYRNDPEHNVEVADDSVLQAFIVCSE